MANQGNANPAPAAAVNAQINVATLRDALGILRPPPPRPGHSARLAAFKTGNPVDWIAWRLHFEKTVDLKGWGREEAINSMAQAMQETACRLVASVVIPPNATIQAALDLYAARFLPPEEGQLAREEFRAARQRHGESITAWNARLTELFMRAWPRRDRETDEELIHSFATGLDNRAVGLKVKDQLPQTLEGAVALATLYYANAKSQYSEGRHRVAQLQQVAALQPVKHDQDVAHGTCYHCLKPGHHFRACPQRSYAREEMRGRAQDRRPQRQQQQRQPQRPRRRPPTSGAPPPRPQQSTLAALSGVDDYCWDEEEDPRDNQRGFDDGTGSESSEQGN